MKKNKLFLLFATVAVFAFPLIAGGCTKDEPEKNNEGITDLGDNNLDDNQNKDITDDNPIPIEIGELEFILSASQDYYSVSGIGTLSSSQVVIPDTYNQLPVTEIANNAFKGLLTIESVVIPEGVTSIGTSAFYGCENLKSVVIPDSVTNISTFAFYNCLGLESAIIPDGVTMIQISTFKNCTSLKTVTIGTGVTSVKDSAFEGCVSLESFEFPDGAAKIGSSTFSGCTSLTSIVIPASVTTISSSAFTECVNLKDIYFSGSSAEWDAIDKAEGWDDDLTDYILHVPDAE